MNKTLLKYRHFLFFFPPVCIFTAIYMLGWQKTWDFLLVPSVTPSFFDLRILQGIVQSAHTGLNPQLSNPFDPSQRLLNYPLIWIPIAQYLGFSNEIFFYIWSIGVDFLYLLCCFKLFKLSNPYWAGLIIYSGSSLLAMERGNTDLIIFILIFFSVFGPTWSRLLLIQISIALKLYPIFSLITLFKNPKTMIFGILLSSLIFYFYKDQLALILGNTQISYGLSYGTATITNGLATKFEIDINKWILNLIFFATALYIFLRKRHLVDFHYISNLEIRLCLVGSSIYVGTFFFTSNWDYRLIFLNLCLPFISKIKMGNLKNLLFGLILLACNQLLLHFLLGAAGVVINNIMKSFCFILCLIFLFYFMTEVLGYFKKNLKVVEKIIPLFKYRK